MQKEDLVALVEKIHQYQCEMQTLELKSAHLGCPTKLFNTLSSFSNQDSGGIILFGVAETEGYKVLGVYDPQDLQKRVTEQCNQMQPIVRPLFSVADIGDKIVVSAEIPGVDISERPVYYKGVGRVRGSFIRVGEADELMSDYENYSYDAFRRRIRDDIRIVDFADASYFNTDLIDKYIAAVKKNKPNIEKLPNEEILSLMGVMRGGSPTLAGLLCLSSYPQAAFPQLCLTAVVIPGTYMGKTGAGGERFLDNKRIEGTIAEILDETIRFISRNMREKTIIGNDGKRSDKTEYPINAVREAVLNALMHRDYSIHTEGTPVRVLMFNDRMEIWNEGALYGRLTIDSIGKIHADTRNQTLVNILELQKVAENRYSGIPTIRSAMASFNLPEPVFETRRGSFIVTLKNDWQTMAESTGTTLLDYCKEPKTRGEIATFLKVTQYYAMKTYVNPLVKAGKLRLTIPDKPKSRNQKYCTFS
ncbi:MAG: putative DNA binding domain-containing protein [Clostridiales bacterium]|nr:putative DNA binding domain-containing protein [Clostridiales bacterium]